MRAPFICNTGANFSAEHLDIEVESDVVFAETRQVGGDRWQVEAAGQAEAGKRQAIILPFCCSAQMRKSLAKPGRRNRDLVCAEASGIYFARGKRNTAQQDHGRPI